MKKLNVALLSGGFSAEREISLKTGQKIAENLDRKKYEIFLFDPKNNFEKLATFLKQKKIDVIFSALHGTFGEDGCFPGVFEILGIPYVFSGVLSSAVAMDKAMTKKLLAAEKILMPKDIVLKKGFSASELKKIKLPVVVKPVSQGSSVGTFVVKDKKDLAKAIEEAFKHDSRVMLEEFINGREVTAPVLGNEKLEALPLIEIRPKISAFFDYRAKYEIGGSEEICPAPLGQVLTKKIQGIAVKVHQTLGCRGVTRSDFIVKNNQPYFLEINTIPGMTDMSLVPQSARQAGINFSRLLDKLIELALEK